MRSSTCKSRYRSCRAGSGRHRCSSRTRGLSRPLPPRDALLLQAVAVAAAAAEAEAAAEAAAGAAEAGAAEEAGAGEATAAAAATVTQAEVASMQVSLSHPTSLATLALFLCPKRCLPVALALILIPLLSSG